MTKNKNVVNENVNKNKDGSFIVGFLVGLIIMLVVAVVLFSTNIISFGNKCNVSLDGDNDKNTNEQVETTKKSENLDSERYASIIEEYKTAINDNEYKNIIDRETKYPNINTNMVHLYHAYDKNVVFKYVFYDINSDKKDEMIVGDGVDGIYEIYTYDGSKVNRFFNSVCLIERCGAYVYDNGIVYFHGSGGASVHVYSFYKIGNDGYSKETIKSYTAEYGESGNVTITDDVTKEVTSFKKSEELITSVIGSATKVDLSKLSWTEIK